MQNALKIVSLIGKIVSVAGAIAWPEIVSPKIAAIIFVTSSILKDLVNRLGDFFDDGQINNSYKG